MAPWRAKLDEAFLEELGAALEGKAEEVREFVRGWMHGVLVA